MNTKMSIRAASPSDLASILQIERDSPAAAHWLESRYSEAIAQPERLVLVAEGSGHIAGFLVASIATPEWELENIVVIASARRQGVGRELMKALISHAGAAGAHEIRQEIRASNLPAQQLGQSTGFVQRGRRKGYYRDPDEDALLFNYLLDTSQNSR